MSDTLIYVWSFNNALQNSWTTGPHALVLGDAGDLIGFHMAGSDRRVFSHADDSPSWQCFVLDGSQASQMNTDGEITVISGSFAGLDLTAITRVGGHYITQSKAIGGGYNTAVDILRYGNNGYRVTAGGVGTEGTFDEVAAADRGEGNQQAHGLLRRYTTGTFGAQGPITFGDDGVATDSRFDDSGVVVVFENRNIGNDKYYLDVVGHASATNVFVLARSTISTAGPWVTCDFAATTGLVDTLTLEKVSFLNLGGAISFSNNADATGHSVNDCTFEGCGAIVAGSVDFLRNLINACGQVTAEGGVMTSTKISGYEGTAGTAALLWNVASDPDGELDNMAFIKGTAATHAIEFGSSTPSTITLTDQTYTGYNAANGNNDSTFYNNTGGALTINIVGGTGNTTYRNGAGASTTINVSVPVTINVTDEAGVGISGVSVRVEEDPSQTLISDGVTDSSGVFSFSFTAATPQDVLTVVRLKGWKPANAFGTIAGGTGLTANFTLIPDPVVNLP